MIKLTEKKVHKDGSADYSIDYDQELIDLYIKKNPQVTKPTSDQIADFVTDLLYNAVGMDRSGEEAKMDKSHKKLPLRVKPTKGAKRKNKRG